ncbi:MAG TPA: hypothetical protein VFQ80_08415 [Thermomicrobiales bacterium]|jgi:hypothetical protein|nr:hypothetical protein [Thermomicrobiales bacterium]
MTRRPSIKRLEARIAELETRFREFVMAPDATGFSDNTCSYGCTAGCTRSCTQIECCGSFDLLPVDEQTASAEPPARIE